MHSLFEQLAIAHHGIRAQVHRLQTEPENLVEVAETLSIAVAHHRTTCTAVIIKHATTIGREHEQQCRLLTTAIRSIDQLVDRLRLPIRDPLLVPRVVDALHALVVEHERLELELALIEFGDAPDRS